MSFGQNLESRCFFALFGKASVLLNLISTPFLAHLTHRCPVTLRHQSSRANSRNVNVIFQSDFKYGVKNV
jgi:hypothetical protein